MRKIEAGIIETALRYGRQDLKATLEKAQFELSKPGKPITYPVKWDSEKQRRAFFATNGFGRGIPTPRSNTYRTSWVLKKTASGYSLSNATSYAEWVGGDAYGKKQSRIHQGRWAVARDVVQEAITTIPTTLPAAIMVAVKQFVRNVTA